MRPNFVRLSCNALCQLQTRRSCAHLPSRGKSFLPSHQWVTIESSTDTASVIHVGLTEHALWRLGNIVSFVPRATTSAGCHEGDVVLDFAWEALRCSAVVPSSALCQPLPTTSVMSRFGAADELYHSTFSIAKARYHAIGHRASLSGLPVIDSAGSRSRCQPVLRDAGRA